MNQTARFHVDPRLATLLGETYRSSEQALKELVDNAWDADAENVRITLPAPMTADPITISDDGTGMTYKEVRKEYLVVANDRFSRKGDRTIGKKRLVKGRKGIGKFAGLMTAELMELETKAMGSLTRLRIKKAELLSTGRDLEGIDLPIGTTEISVSDHGTSITLSYLNQSLAFPNPDRLKQLLILEYGRQTEFNIFVNGEQLDIEDIPGETFDEEVNLPELGKARLRFTIADSKRPLKQSGIVIRVGGKIVGRPSYLGLEEEEHIPQKLLRKIYGEIEADGLADDVTADWGAIIENSKGFTELNSWAHTVLKNKIETVFRKEVNLSKARLQKEINDQLAKIPERRREFARRALDKVLQKFYWESPDKIKTIISVMLEAFETDEYWTVLRTIDESDRADVETFAHALESFGLTDMAFMANQATSRLQLLDQLDVLINHPGTLEKTMHAVIEKNLWILGAEYTLMSSNQTLAKTIEKYANEAFSGSRKNKRPDLFLASNLYGNHLLVEFKRPSHDLTRDDENQAVKYSDDLTPKFGDIIIMIIGRQRHKNIAPGHDTGNMKVMSYANVISKARTQLQWLIDQLMSNV
jgi:hypothetical protein